MIVSSYYTISIAGSWGYVPGVVLYVVLRCYAKYVNGFV
jgi:hypothetical protein